MTDRIVKIRFIGDGITTVAGQVTALGKSTAAAADKMTGASKEAGKFRRGLTEIGGTAGKVGLVAAAGLGAIVVATANFEQSMSRVSAATHASASTMADLRQAAIIAGRDTVFSATEAADAITAMSKAGVSAKDILHGGLTGALSLASAGELDVASAADIAATAMNQFGLQGKDIPHIADLLAASAGKAQGEVTDMANSLKYVGPVAHQMGISIEETTGVIAELASQGILGEQAGTSLRGMLTSLTSPSKLASKTMEQLGITLYDASGKFVGLRGIADQLGSTMGKLTNAERDQALGRIFGNEQITAARILYAGGAEAVDKWTKAVNDQGYAADTAARKMDNLKGDLEQLRGSLETALIGSGSGSQGALRGMVQDVTKVVNAFTELPPAVQSSMTSLLAITALTGGGLWFGAKVIGGVARTRAAIADLGVTATQTKTALAGLGKGVEFVAIVEGVKLLDKSLQGLLHQNLDTSKLAGDLQTLGETGQVTGTLARTFGPDMAKFGKYASEASSGMAHLTDKLYGFLPGDTTLDIAQRNLKAVDDTLTEMVRSGNADQAAQIFDLLAASADKQGISTAKLNDLLPGYAAYMVKNSGAAQMMTDAMTGLIDPTSAMGKAVAENAADLEAQAKALEANRKRARETADSFFGLGQKVNDTKTSLNSWIDDLNKQASALRDFTKNVKKAAKEGLDEGLINSLEQAGPEGAMRLQQLANASDAEIARANKAWKRGERAIDEYVNVVGGVPPVVATTVTTNTDAALARIRQIRREMDQIPRTLRTDYWVIQHNALNKPKIMPGGPASADGGTIPGARYPYGDKVLTPTAPGEEVISNRHGQADKWRPLLKAINAGMADGGTVGRSMPAGAMSALIDYDRLAGAVSGNRLIAHRDTRDAMLSAMRTALREMPVFQMPTDRSLLYGAS